MLVSVDHEDDATATYTFQDEDHTLGNPLSRYLLEHPSVVYAAYNVPHPLENTMKITLMTSGEGTTQVMKSSLTTMSLDLQSLLESFDEAVESH